MNTFSDFCLKNIATILYRYNFFFIENLKKKSILYKALYSLREAPKAWYEKIDSFLKNQGFIKREGDYNLYVIDYHEKILLLILYEDELLFTRNYIN